MKKALNKYGKLVDIIESIKEETYICPVCKEELIRNFGISRQYFSHPNGRGDECELKLKLMVKDGEKEFDEKEIDILRNEYYEKVFDDVNIELSDYISEEGYYLTQEQKDIIFAEEDRIKIAALAGSSKSTTLYYYAKTRPFKKILYVVYNKSMKEEFEKLYSKQRHITIKTQHGFAYGIVGKFYKNKLTFNYGVVDIIKDLKLDWNKDMELAVKIDAMMKKYMLSDKFEFEEIELFKDEDGNTTEQRELIIQKSKELWELKKDYKNLVKVEHDFYLKLFHLSKMDLSNKFDIIMVDECQDLSKLLLDILKSSNVKGIVICGDIYQSLYGWRDSVNILPLFEGKEYKLTTSFRVSQNIANIANIIIKDIYKIDINMKGFNDKQKIVNEIDKKKPYVCLCRTNAFILGEAIEVITANKNAKLYFESGFSSYNFSVLKDAYWFSRGHKVNNPLFNKFENYEKMIKYAEKVIDIEIISINRMIEKYGSLIPEIIDGIKNNTTTDLNKANVIFSTIHKAKGKSISLPLYISDDILDLPMIFNKEYINKDNDKDFKIQDFYEEANIVYVGITRSSGICTFSDKIKDYLIMRYNYFKDKEN